MVFIVFRPAQETKHEYEHFPICSAVAGAVESTAGYSMDRKRNPKIRNHFEDHGRNKHERILFQSFSDRLKRNAHDGKQCR